MTDALVCTRCGALIPTGARFCVRCGFAVATRERSPSPSEPAGETQLATLRQATLGEYEILHELGRGSISTVYLAHDIALDRKVAIKVMSPMLLNADGRAELKHSLVRVSQLSHPHIIRIYAVRETGDLLYFVMNLVEGRSVESIVREGGPLPVAVVQAVLHQVSSALGYAHRHGVIHGDIKPANIMLDADGWAIVTDLGIAKASDSQGLTLTGASIGPPAYLSPEQCRASERTGAADQYSLGIVAYEMLAGQVPFVGESVMQVMFAHLHETPPPLQQIRDDCPPELAATVMRMLEKNPDRRFQSMEACTASLESAAPDPAEPVRLQMTVLARASENVKASAPLAAQPTLASPAVRMNTGFVVPPVESQTGAVAAIKPPVPRKTGSIVASVFSGIKSLVGRDDRVYVGAAAPESARPGEEFVAWFVAHRKEFESAIRRHLQDQSPRAIPRLGINECRWARGTTVRVQVAGDHLRATPQEETFVWQGDWTSVSFDIRVAPDAPLGVTVLKFDISIGSLRVAKVRLDLKIATKVKSKTIRHVTATPARTAFASYAMEDHAEVLGRLSSIRTSTGLDVFVDCLSLRPGEKWKARLRREIRKRNLFLLFWSPRAKASEWVEWEWRTALTERGLDVIQPHPLKPVSEAPPPPELSSLHFGDAYVLARQAYERSAG